MTSTYEIPSAVEAINATATNEILQEFLLKLSTSSGISWNMFFPDGKGGGSMFSDKLGGALQMPLLCLIVVTDTRYYIPLSSCVHEDDNEHDSYAINVVSLSLS